MTTNNQLTFQPGKFYKTRDGRKAQVLATDMGGDFPVIYRRWNPDENRWSVTNTVTPEGGYLLGGKPAAADLIAEWKDAPSVDWSKMPAWANCVAMDDNGTWYYYEQPPMTYSHHWDSNGFNGKIPPDFAPKWSGDWRESLVTREGTK